MPPMLAFVIRRVALIKQMPLILPVTQTIRIVEHALGIHIVVMRSVWVRLVLADLLHAIQQRIRCERFALLEQVRWEYGERYFRLGIFRHGNAC